MGISCAGLTDIPNPFATQTPTPTNTFTPSPTSTVTPSPTATLPPPSTPAPSGAQKKKLLARTTLFIDYDNKYRFVLPEEWVAIPFNKGEFSSALGELAENNPDLVESAAAFKDLDPDVVRLLALNRDPKFFVNGAATNLSVTAVKDGVLSAMPLSFITGVLEESFKQSGVKVITEGVNTIRNIHGIEVEFIDTEQSANGSTIAQRLMIFQSNRKVIVITLTTLKQFAKDVFLASDLICATIEPVR